MVPQTAIENLKKHLRGQLLRPQDPGYDEARKIWNGMIEKRPALIARCNGAGDVVNSVKFAREHDLTVAVRGGGHNIAGKCVPEGGFLIDLSGMKGIRVDPTRRIARAEAGLKLGDFDRETQAFGLRNHAGNSVGYGHCGHHSWRRLRLACGQIRPCLR